MGLNNNPDFRGWATKNDLLCSDGRIIRQDAFADNDGKRVPLVWQHGHSDISNVIGHAILENRTTGVYTRGFINDTPQGDVARDLLSHGDINSLSIYANRLQHRGNEVIHGNIVEVSLVLAGANPGAMIEHVSIQHSDGTYEDDPEEAVIHTGIIFEEDDVADQDNKDESEEMTHAESSSEKTSSEQEKKSGDDGSDKTVGDIYEAMTDEQKAVVHYMLAQIAGDEDDATAENKMTHTDEEENSMTHTNVFEDKATANGFAFVNSDGRGFTHAEMDEIADEVFSMAKDGGKLSDALSHAAKEYGISNIEDLFPNAKTLSGDPTWVKPEDDWVPSVVDAVSRTPFARIKSEQIDLTEEKLRAKGYITGSQKKDGVFKVLSRTTTPQTVYIRSKLDRDDIIDATDHDVVAYVKEAMRIRFRSEIAQAILIGDGRQNEDAEKINEEHIRPIYSEDDFYASKLVLPNGVTNEQLVEKILRGQKNFKGHGLPVFFTTFDVYMDLLLQKEKVDSNRRLYNTDAELCAAMHVSKIVVVDQMEGKKREVSGVQQELIGILVNPADYTIGMDRGGDIFNAEDFDIDFNQYKYLMESRMSGALKEPKTAIVVERKLS